MVAGTIFGILFGIVLVWLLIIVGAGCLIYLSVKLIIKVINKLKNGCKDGDQYGINVTIHKNN